MSVRHIVVLGGYGNFGKRITESLAVDASLTITIAGRSQQKAENCCRHLKGNGANATLESATIDLESPCFSQQLAQLKPDLVIHTCGPFQGQDYRVPKACIALGCHYIDLADDRRFVCDINTLDQAAREKGVLLVSGASSVPGLSSTVIDHYLPEFKQLDGIDFAIAPGNKAERGEATVKAILSYTGHPIPVYEGARWRQRHGWMSLRRWNFGGAPGKQELGKRWLANVDIPDLELFPARYQPVRTVRFQAGLELSVLHLTMAVMAFLARIRLVRNWAPLSGPIHNLGNWFKRFGSDMGGMQIRLQGQGLNSKEKTLCWMLYAEHGIGPYIPTFSAVILARKLVAGEPQDIGAKPCLGLYSLDEFDALADQFGIYYQVKTTDGEMDG